MNFKHFLIGTISGVSTTLIAGFAGFQVKPAPMVFFTSLGAIGASYATQKFSGKVTHRDVEIAMARIEERWALHPDRLNAYVALEELRRELRGDKL